MEKIKRLKVLFIDDVTFYKSLVEDHIKLMKIDYSFVSFTNMEDAANNLKESAQNGHFYDLIVSDLNIPGGKSGTDLVKAVRSSDKFKTTPFILLTSETDKEILLDALNSGIDAFLTKPWTYEEFSKTVVSTLKRYDRILSIA